MSGHTGIYSMLRDANEGTRMGILLCVRRKERDGINATSPIERRHHHILEHVSILSSPLGTNRCAKFLYYLLP